MKMPSLNKIRENANNSNVLSTANSRSTVPLVSVLNNTVVTTSIIVAEYFGKDHKSVLRAIRSLECSAEFNRRNFAPVEYKDTKCELRPMYYLTRDGFTFLAMGFTGKVAAKFKEAYINAFNEMEAKLNQSNPTLETLKKETQKQREENYRFMQKHVANLSNAYCELSQHFRDMNGKLTLLLEQKEQKQEFKLIVKSIKK